MQLVPGRECGECSACCRVLNVDTPEFQKLPGKPCAHLGERGGCTIHATRYPVCRAYHCGWRYLAGLGEDWRPDKSGILIDFQHEDLPPHYPKRPGIRVTLFGAPVEALPPVFLEWVSLLVASEVPLVLAAPGPPGHYPAGAFMNDALRQAAAQHDISAIGRVFAEAFKGLSGHRFTPVVHHHGGQGEIPAGSVTFPAK